MIDFDAVDFSERRSEEVISFFWHSVYITGAYIALSNVMIKALYNETKAVLIIKYNIKSCFIQKT